PEFGQYPLVEADLRARVPALEDHVRLESGHLGSSGRRRAFSSRDLVREHEQQKVLVVELLLLSEQQAVGQNVDQLAELQGLERALEFRRDHLWFVTHRAPPSGSLPRVEK